MPVIGLSCPTFLLFLPCSKVFLFLHFFKKLLHSLCPTCSNYSPANNVSKTVKIFFLLFYLRSMSYFRIALRSKNLSFIKVVIPNWFSSAGHFDIQLSSSGSLIIEVYLLIYYSTYIVRISFL